MKDNTIESMLEERNALALKYFNTNGDPHIFLLKFIGICVILGGIGHYIGRYFYDVTGADLLPWLICGPIICCVVVCALLIVSYKTDHNSTTQKILDKILCSKYYERNQIKKSYQDLQEKIVKLVKQHVTDSKYEYLTVLIYDQVYHYSDLKDIQIRPSDQEIGNNLKSLIEEYRLNSDACFAHLLDKMYIELFSNKTIIELAGLSRFPLMDTIGENCYNYFSQDLINQIIANSKPFGHYSYCTKQNWLTMNQKNLDDLTRDELVTLYNQTVEKILTLKSQYTPFSWLMYFFIIWIGSYTIDRYIIQSIVPAEYSLIAYVMICMLLGLVCVLPLHYLLKISPRNKFRILYEKVFLLRFHQYEVILEDVIEIMNKIRDLDAQSE